MSDKRPPLNELNKDQLVSLVELLLARVSTLEKQVVQLKQGDKPLVKKTPHNSSVPPSQGQKANRVDQPQAKRGAKPGHEGKSRERSEADEVIECRVQNCDRCGASLEDTPQWVVSRHQVLDLPAIRPVVREAQRYRAICPHCKREQTAAYGVGFEKGRVFGRRLERLVVYLHHAHPLSYERVQRILADLWGVKISRGALVNGVKRAEKMLQSAAEHLHQQVKQAAVIGSDETTARVNGVTMWQWVFQTPTLAYHVIRPSRSAQVIAEVLADAQPQVWVSDLLSSQLCHPAQTYQICLAHQVRDLQYGIDMHDCPWARQMQTLLRDAMHLHRQRDRLEALTFARQRAACEDRLDELLAHPPDYADSETLRCRFVKHRRALFLFLYREDVPPTNNASEQALRNSVIYRKVTGGFRSAWAAELYANLISILETVRRQGGAIFQTLDDILDGQPVFSTPSFL